MKTLGLIGGLSWESTALYYRIINEAVKQKLGGLHSAKMLVWSFDFSEIAALQAAGDWDGATAQMVLAAEALKRGGCEGLVICTNTMHMMADTIEDVTGLAVIHIADTTAQAICKQGMKKVGLLATRFTMEQDFYKSRLKANHGIEVVIPDAAGRDVVHGIIYDELCQGIISDESRAAYVRVIDQLVAQGAQGIVLGCTEICLLLGQQDVAVPLFDTTQHHALAAANWSLS